MIGPKKKISIRKKHTRHSAWRTKVMKKLMARTQISNCKNCNKPKLSHRVCGACGYYGGKQVMTIKTSSSNQVLEA